MKCSSACASMLPSGRNGVSMIGDLQSTSRSTTTKRLERPSACRLSTTRANNRCEVELPMSMPTVVSAMVSCSQMARAILALSASDKSSCSCSSSKSCILGRSLRSGRGADRLRRADDAGERLRRQRENLRLVENVTHLGAHARDPDRVEPFAMDARVLILVLDLAAALLH